MIAEIDNEEKIKNLLKTITCAMRALHAANKLPFYVGWLSRDSGGSCLRYGRYIVIYYEKWFAGDPPLAGDEYLIVKEGGRIFGRKKIKYVLTHFYQEERLLLCSMPKEMLSPILACLEKVCQEFNIPIVRERSNALVKWI